MHSLCCEVLKLILGLVFCILGHDKDKGKNRKEKCEPSPAPTFSEVMFRYSSDDPDVSQFSFDPFRSKTMFS